MGGGNELGVHATGEGTPIKNVVSEDMQSVGARTPIGRIMPDRRIIPTPGLTFEMKNLEVEDNECLCSNLCECVELQQTDRYVQVSKVGARTPIGRSINRGIIHTPGLSTRMKYLEVEDEECLCSRECVCTNLEHILDECICTSECLEVGHGKKETEDIMDRQEQDKQLGILYCPDPSNLCLPGYIFKGYKPSTSKQYQNINVSTIVPTICTESDNVVVEGEIENEVSLGLGVDSIIAVWEEMARDDMLEPPLCTNGGWRGERRQSQEFTNLIELFEKGGGGRNEKQPELKETKCQKLSFIVSKISEFEEKKGGGGC